jgi:hypothetical protein
MNFWSLVFGLELKLETKYQVPSTKIKVLGSNLLIQQGNAKSSHQLAICPHYPTLAVGVELVAPNRLSRFRLLTPDLPRGRFRLPTIYARDGVKL